MDTVSMNSGNRFKELFKYAASSNHSFYYIWGNIKSHIK